MLNGSFKIVLILLDLPFLSYSEATTLSRPLHLLRQPSVTQSGLKLAEDVLNLWPPYL